MSNLTLGLDLGTNSIGWALLESDEQQEPQKLVDCGARIFQEAVEAKTRTPKNRARREARGVRRLHARRKMRRQALLSILETHDMLPVQTGEINSNSSAGDPYTRWAAWHVWKENSIGSIEPGKWADLVVLDQDYMTVSEDEMEQLNPLLTIVGGQVRYSEPNYAAGEGLPQVGFQAPPGWWNR